MSQILGYSIRTTFYWVHRGTETHPERGRAVFLKNLLKQKYVTMSESITFFQTMYIITFWYNK